MDNSDEPEDLLDGKIVFQKNKDRTFSKTKQYPPNHRNAKHVLVGEGRSSGMRQTRLTRRTHCAKEAPMVARLERSLVGFGVMVGHLCQSQRPEEELKGSGVCLRNTSRQLHTVSNSGSNGMSPAGAEKRGAERSEQNCKLSQKRLKSPKSRAEEAFRREPLILCGRLKEGYAAGHVNLKEIIARHNDETNDHPVLLRLPADLLLVWVELLSTSPGAQPCLSLRGAGSSVRTERSGTTLLPTHSGTVESGEKGERLMSIARVPLDSVWTNTHSPRVTPGDVELVFSPVDVQARVFCETLFQKESFGSVPVVVVFQRRSVSCTCAQGGPPRGTRVDHRFDKQSASGSAHDIGSGGSTACTAQRRSLPAGRCSHQVCAFHPAPFSAFSDSPHARFVKLSPVDFTLHSDNE
ncbi:unnamed protein product [Pleuronectes platessa]|uniref:Uncharacterized protein n=1 Tax=Pleuronectes platessa TaxID=8262 RepID=A0A9N7Y6H4_PLEPL|nr:unnamed protein product [Pleuronectes platessa]